MRKASLRFFAISASALMAVMLAGCAITNETSMVTGRVRPATYPEDVRLYSSPPKRYEEIGIVSADAAHDFMQKQALLDTAIANARKEAAKLGANGILLDEAGDFVTGSSGVIVSQPSRGRSRMTVGTGSFNNRTGKLISGRAIYVIEE